MFRSISALTTIGMGSAQGGETDRRRVGGLVAVLLFEDRFYIETACHHAQSTSLMVVSTVMRFAVTLPLSAASTVPEGSY
jgi:hypothetical protein